jgi:hypothetical protein
LITVPGGLVTDAEGRLVLDGIPRGTYEWTCTSPGGVRASGTERLPPRGRVELQIRLDDR